MSDVQQRPGVVRSGGPTAVRLGLDPRRRPGARWARCSVRRWGRRAARPTAPSAGSPRSSPTQGIVALRFDYDGTGDSAGLQDDPDRVASWLASIEAARQYLLDLGVADVSAVGMRLGATLAGCQAAASTPFRSLVLWDPCLSGRTFLREGEALFALGEDDGRVHQDGLRHTPGFQYDEATAKAMRTDRPRQDPRRPAARRPGAAARRAPTGRRPRASSSGSGSSRARSSSSRRSPRTSCSTWRRATTSSRAEALADVVDLAGRRGRPGPPSRSRPPRRAPSGSPPRARGRPRSSRARCASARARHLRRARRAGRRRSTARRGWCWSTSPPSTTSGPGRRWVEWARAVGRAGLPRRPHRPERHRRQPHARRPDRGRAVRARVDRRHAPGRAAPVRRRRPGRGDGALLRRLLGVRGRAVGARSTRSSRSTRGSRCTRRPRARPSTRRCGAPASCPNRPFAALAERHRILAGGMWRIYRQLAVWHAPFRIVRVGASSAAPPCAISACRDDAQHFTEVVFWRPFLARLAAQPATSASSRTRSSTTRCSTRAGQLVTFERATDVPRPRWRRCDAR